MYPWVHGPLNASRPEFFWWIIRGRNEESSLRTTNSLYGLWILSDRNWLLSDIYLILSAGHPFWIRSSSSSGSSADDIQHLCKKTANSFVELKMKALMMKESSSGKIEFLLLNYSQKKEFLIFAPIGSSQILGFWVFFSYKNEFVLERYCKLSLYVFLQVICEFISFEINNDTLNLSWHWFCHSHQNSNVFFFYWTLKSHKDWKIAHLSTLIQFSDQWINFDQVQLCSSLDRLRRISIFSSKSCISSSSIPVPVTDGIRTRLK